MQKELTIFNFENSCGRLTEISENDNGEKSKRRREKRQVSVSLTPFDFWNRCTKFTKLLAH